jgi:hypothetical protein
MISKPTLWCSSYIAMPPALSIPAKRALSSKEASLFRELLSQYETRQLKKGLKSADQILKKVPEHGGGSITLVMHIGCSNRIAFRDFVVHFKI